MKLTRKVALLAIAIPSIGFLLFLNPLLAEEDSPPWSYDGADNPTQWSSLGDDFAQCAIGTDQSPIDINDAVNGKKAKIEFNYTSVPLNVVNNGHTIQVNYEPGSNVRIDGEEYELLQFHFHTPSEHIMAGKASAMEVHLVHRNQSGKLAVVGVMMEKGAENPLIAKIWQHSPKKKGNKTVSKLMINAADLLPSSKTYFSYTGSLTTPPCSEGVMWNVLAETIQVSEEQIAKFQGLYRVNARPVQSTNGRTIELHQE